MFKKLQCFILIMAILLLTGCATISPSTDALIQVPKGDPEFEGIMTAFKKHMYDEYTLVYPLAGDYRNPISVFDIDNDGVDEAIVLFKSKSIGDNVRINVLEKNRDGSWESVENLSGAGTEVDKIEFVKLASGGYYTAIGFKNMNSSDKEFFLYKYENRKFISCFEEKYTEFASIDMELDQADEFVLLKNDLKENITVATLYTIEHGKVHSVASTFTDEKVKNYVSIDGGMLNKNTPALFIDGDNGANTVSTEILIYEDGELKNILFDIKNNLTYQTVRTSTLKSYDYNNDGITEIPAMLIKNQSDINKDLYLTQFKQYDSSKFNVLFTGYYDEKFGYFLEIPVEFNETIVVKNSEVLNEQIFYYVQNVNDKEIWTEVLRVRCIVPFVENNRAGLVNYREILKKANVTVYARINQEIMEHSEYISYDYLKTGLYFLDQ